MYLEKLKIFGFKSFARKTEIQFLPGITAIVGPNGCGKSNVVDAIRWVLGEQKAGTLRSERMESVIFNGSKNIKPLGMAEVSLIIQNSDSVLPVEYSEVVLTRRLFRSGESQYLLNNSPCRLKDINDLLMDTGLTPDAYSVIELSMVEQILNGKPEDRRRIFEEAVGLTKYKQRRKLTFRKLDATEQDLLRIADIIGEVRSKVNSLHRQVRRAQRYQALSKNLSEAEIRLATYKFSRIYEELIPLNHKFEELNRSRESLSSQISFKEAEMETVQTELIEVEDLLRQAQIKLNEITNAIHKSEEEILLSRERLKSLAENKTRLSREIEVTQQKVMSRQEQMLEIQKQQNLAAVEISHIKQDFNREKAAFDELEKQINQQKLLVREAEQTVYSLLQTISEKQRNADRLNAQIENLEQRQLNLNQEKQSQLQKISQEQQAKIKRQTTLEDYQTKLELLVEEQSAFENEAETIQQAIDELKSIILQKNNQIESAQTRQAFLKELLESYADYPEGVKYLMKNYGATKGFLGTMAGILQVDEAHRKAIEAALGDSAAFLLVDDEPTAYAGINSLTERQQGLVTFLPVTRLHFNKQNVILKEEAGVIGWANELVKCDTKYSPAVEVLLSAYLIVDDFETAQKLAAKVKGQPVQLVTRRGEIIFNWGGIRGGKKATESESIIGRQDQLNQLIKKSVKLDDELKKAEAQLKEQESARAENLRQKTDRALQAKNLQEDISKSQVELSQIQYRLQQANEIIAHHEDELRSIAESREAVLRQIREIEPDLQQHGEKHTNQQEKLKQHQAETELLERQRKQQAEKVNQINLDLVEKAGLERGFVQALAQTEKLIREDEIAIEASQKAQLENESQREHFETRIDELGKSLAGDYSIKEKNEAEVESLNDKAKTIRINIDERNKATNKILKERETVLEAQHEAELRISELRINADNLYRRMMEEYDWELKRELIDPNNDRTVDEKEVERLREIIKRLGPVNLLALKEYEKEKERLDFLEKQQEDLITAEQNLKQTIEHINKTAQDKFDSLFNEIRQNFVKVFKDFFPGGEADLVIEADDDPLEANIEIIASPKGKKMESLSLLSGGEKALTAISLLFGIYLVKPSPVCILDEVDAPLDDNNIKRFIKALKQFSDSTQFLMVTHNKLSMKSSGALFGITMEESGVSKVVSVKLE